MSLWLCRAGKMGEHETKFIEDNSIYCTWREINWDMTKFGDREALKEELRKKYPDLNTAAAAVALGVATGQLWTFRYIMKSGDLVVLPSKIKPVIYVGEISSEYKFSADVDPPYQHARSIKWLKGLPRASFDQDLIYSFGSLLTICQITRNDAEQRIRDMLTAPATAAQFPPQAPPSNDGSPVDASVDVDIEETALEEIAAKLIAKYKGHGMASVIAAILEAKGYTTFVSPPGPDNGVDILASLGALGFDPPRICVQVKSGDSMLERPTLDQLIGAMSNHKADYGMLVSWGGFKSSILRDTANHFFKVRLWTHKDIVQEFLRHYNDLPEDIREAIPLKRIWIIDKRDV